MIFFDIDDTLLDYKSSQDRAALVFAQNYSGHIFNADQFVETWHQTTERHMARYLAGEISFQEQRRCRIQESLGLALTSVEADRIFDEYYQIYEESWQLFPDVLSVLDQLSDFPLAVITNGDKTHQTYKLDRLGLLPYFSNVITPACAGAAKPDPVIFRVAARIINRKPQECWYIGDNYAIDYHGALASGYKSVWLNRANQPGPCDNQCKDLHEFLLKVQTLTSKGRLTS